MNKDAKKAKAKEFAEQKMLEERAEIEAKAKKMEEEAQKSWMKSFFQNDLWKRKYNLLHNPNQI